MILNAREAQEHELRKVVGSAIPFNLRKMKASGSSGLFLKSFTNYKNPEKALSINSKCSFENRVNGILLRSYNSNVQMMVALPLNEISKIQLIKGDEINHLSTFSLGGVFHKIGLSLRYARYLFPYRFYRIDPMDLIIYSKNYKMTFRASGYQFENQLDFWRSSSAAAKLTILDKNEEWNSSNL